MEQQPRIAYFSMEIGLDAAMRTYSGGLGVLAGDTIRSAADLRVPMVAVSLLHRRGYCRQSLDEHGNQIEEPNNWPIEDFLRRADGRASVEVEGREVHIIAWIFEVLGFGGFRVPVYFLDTDLPENDDAHRGFTHHLYGGDNRYRLCQEVVLGIGGVRMLRALGYDGIDRFHMNEGHAGLLACELLREYLAGHRESQIDEKVLEKVRESCVFTTHTPVPAGHDQFPADVAGRVLGGKLTETLRRLDCLDGSLNMTELALHMSRFVNGVARRHGEISRKLFSDEAIDSITNGVHVRTWAAPTFQKLFDQYIPTWREDSFGLRNALSIPNHEVWEAHQRAKEQLIEQIAQRTGEQFDADVFTVGFARRMTAYKRPDLFFHDLERLRRVHREVGPLQIVLAGKAHPHDEIGKDMIRRVFHARAALRDQIRVTYLPDYGMRICQFMVSGVDLWLNTPEPPMEASGTSGMKAAINGVPSLSVLDGWWLEGWIEGTTGWSIGRWSERPDRERDAASLYDKMEHVILPLFYRRRGEFVDIMRHCIALNGSFFNTHRMMHQYVVKAYFV